MPSDRFTPGIRNQQHVVVLMMRSRSFDHMLGGLHTKYPSIDGLTGAESNPDTKGTKIHVTPTATYQGQFVPAPADDFAAVNLQIFDSTLQGELGLKSTMGGFVKSYFDQHKDVNRSYNVLSYFTPDKLPVLTSLATEFAVFNRWFSSIPGPTVCNRAFAHYGTSFGQVGTGVFYWDKQYKSIYERLEVAGHATKVYRYDEHDSSIGLGEDTLENWPSLFGTFSDFMDACNRNQLPEYSFVEPNYTDHDAPDGSGQLIACDQHPDHDVRAGEQFIATIYNAIRQNPNLWPNTTILVVYDEHGGIYDHVPPPACVPDGFVAQPNATGTPAPFHFDRLGVRVPAILISPWVPRGTVINEVFEHASIPATVTEFFIGKYDARSPREIAANTFLNALSLPTMRPDSDCPKFVLEDLPIIVSTRTPERQRKRKSKSSVDDHPLAESLPDGDESVSAQTVASLKSETAPQDHSRNAIPQIAGYSSDAATGEDLLEITMEVRSLCSVLAAKEVEPPISVGLFGDWGSGKTFFMQEMEKELRYIKDQVKASRGGTAYCSNIVQLWFNAWHYVDANLWASLASHIFEGLGDFVSPEKGNQEAKAFLLSELESAKELKAEAERERERAVRERENTERELNLLADARAKTEAKLVDLRVGDLQRLLDESPTLKKDLDGALKSLGLPPELSTVDSLEALTKDAHRLGGRFQAAILSGLHQLIRPSGIAALLIIVLAVILSRNWFPSLLEGLPRLIRVAVGALPVLIGVITIFAKSIKQASGYLDKFDETRKEVWRLLEEKKQQKTTEELILESNLNQIKARETGTSQQFSVAQSRVREIEEKIQEIDEGRNLSKFILERVKGDDYRKHLGLISSIRRDFETLNRLLPRGRTADTGIEIKPIERIVLYVDDLDRCPEAKVVEVLQAIHLLLFFPIFVVVVGVDSRWLLHSLKGSSRAFQSEHPWDDNASVDEIIHWQSTPLNYLEKIFQIPFAVRPMDVIGYQNLINRLTDLPTIAKEIRGNDLAQGNANLLAQEQLLNPRITASKDVMSSDYSSELVPDVLPSSLITSPPDRYQIHDDFEIGVINAKSSRTFDPNPKYLRIEENERQFLRQLHPLIPSPRAAKRLVNIYRLLRTSIGETEMTQFLELKADGEFQAVLLLLAIQTGFPVQGMQIIRDLTHCEPNLLWWDFVNKYGLERTFNTREDRTKGQPFKDRAPKSKVRLEKEHFRELLEKLKLLPPNTLVERSCEVFKKWAPLVSRYSFQSVSGQ